MRSRLSWTDTVFEAWSAISRRPARTLLTALGTILGVAAFVATTGLASTASAQVSESFDALKATEVRVQDAAPDGESPFPLDVEDRLGRLNGVRHAGLIYAVPNAAQLDPRATASRSESDSRRPISIYAVSPGLLRASLSELRTGREFDEFHFDRSERVAVLGRVVADQLGITRIDNQPAVFVGDIGFTVIGILDQSERNPDLLLSVLIPASTEASIVQSLPSGSEIVIDVDPGAAALIGRQAPLALRPHDPGRLTALIPPDPSSLRRTVETDVTSLYYALALLSLAVGTIAIANATLLSTIERRPEIGLRRALGATRRHVVRQILLEAATTGTFAGLVGTALAVIAVGIVSAARSWTTTIDPIVVLVAPLIGLATGAIAGMLPALRAARVAPAITLRS